MLNLQTTFREVKKAGAGWMAKCPGHDDGKSSLSIGLGDAGRILLKCHAGCDLDRILAAARLTPADLFPVDNTTAKAKIVATYRYEDEGRAHLYDVVRFSPKDFRQRHADGSWKMGHVRRVLYRLPELQGQSVVYVVEGEKDAEALVKIGVAATSNVSGAGKWTADFTAQLIAAAIEHVVVIPDNDDPGRQHAEDVARSCHGAGLKTKIVELPGLPAKGDVSDWLAAGGDRGALVALVKATPLYAPSAAAVHAEPEPTAKRRLTLTRASDIKVRPVRWLWALRLALGTLGLIGGREGIGKSIAVTTLVAALTRGKLEGVYHGTPKAVVVVATEDSWEHTIVPRLMAAQADLDLVFRVDVVTSDVSSSAALSLPRDLPELERVVVEEGAAAIVVDPLLSRLDTDLDSHKDAEVRLALEPLVSLAERTGATILGLIHVNKSGSSDALTTLMGSRAFAAVARSVLFVMVDPDNEKCRLLGQAKNNLGRSDLPTLGFTIQGHKVLDTDEGPVWTGRLEWTGESTRSIRDALQVASEHASDRSATSEAVEWLTDYLTSYDGPCDSADIKRAGQQAGHSKNTLFRSKEKLNIVSATSGFPRRAFWSLPIAVVPTSGESSSNGINGTTGISDVQQSHSSHSSHSSGTPHARDQEVTRV